MAYGFSANDS